MSRLIDWKNLCLVCLKKGENRSIFDQDSDSNLIADKIMECADIFIEKDTKQLKCICLQCLDNLNVTYKFHRNYEQSDSIIQSLLSTNHQEFQIKDLWKTSPYRGAKQKGSPQREIFHIAESAKSNEITIKHEIIENDVVDDTHDNYNPPSIDLGDNIDTEAKFVLKDPAEACFHGSAIEQNDLKSNESNKIKHDANEEISGRLRSDSKASIENSCDKPSNNERPFSCERCDKTFVTSWKLRRHIKVHTAEKPYECQYCDRRFAEKTQRKPHERIHTGEKPYECQYCDRRFTQKGQRKTHERMHTGERPFLCPTCGKSFAYSRSLSNHRCIHTGVKKFMCGECGKGFDKRVLLLKHVARHMSRDKLINNSSEHDEKEMLKKEVLKSVECNLNEINIKQVNDLVDYACGNDNSPYLDMEDDPVNQSKSVVEDRTNVSFASSAIKQNDFKSKESNKIKQEANDEISGRLRSDSKASIENPCDKPSNNKRPFSCERCDKTFVTSWKLRRHIKVHTAEKPYECQYCDRRFAEKTQRKTHERIHTGEKPYECQYCDRRFTQKGQRKTHERMHTGERPFLCPTCGKSFAYSRSLSNHRCIHTVVKKFMCGECGKGFDKRVLLLKHVARHMSRDKLINNSSEHDEKEMLKKEVLKSVECNLNEINIKQVNDLVDYACGNDNSPYLDMEDDPVNQSKSVVEDRTNVSFASSAIKQNDFKSKESNKIKQEANDEISGRLRSDSKASIENSCDKPSNNKRPFSCERCDKTFVTSWKLRRHIKVHTAEKPYECQYCDRRFAEKTQRKTHERIHTGEKPYECQYCDRRFTQKGQRKTHERMHTGERPFLCPTCGKSFAYSHSLSNHRCIHTGVKKFMCEECGKGFNRKKPLERHVRHHQSQDKLDKSSEHRPKRVLEKEILQIEQCAKSNEINIKHELKLVEEEID